ncbi:MAG TPA: AarF/UbiB family protein [Phycisphaerales bacterium]|nr:AarF/UbiB family protein [Phycisphaerales bacterium]
MALPFQHTFRNVRRYQQVLRVLARYGFGGFVHEAGLDRLLERGFRLFGSEVPTSIASMTPAERVRRAMEELGPTFIKLGQILSTRRDLIPDDWAVEFSRLQDSVPADPWAEVKVRLDEAFGEELATLFAFIDEKPLAAASMAQVHAARRPDGREVVLKILRPGLHDMVDSDMEALRFIAHQIEGHVSNVGVSPVEVVDEFARQLKRELDLTHEGRSTDRLRAAFADDPGVGFPEVHWDATADTVLTLQRIDGVPLSRADIPAIPLEERKLAVDHGAKAVLRQCLELGFFHADPHPGNLFLVPGGKIVFIDMGMTGRIEPQTRKTIARLVHGTATGDVEEVARAALAIGDVDPETVDERALRQDVQEIVGFFHDVPLERFDLSELLEMFFSALRRHHVKVPADLALLIKALSSIEGVGKMLDPDFDMVAYVRPYIERIMLEQASPLAVARRMKEAALVYAQLAETLPQELLDLMTRLRRSRLTVNLEHRGLSEVTTVIEHASRNIAYALTIAALVVGSSIIVLASRTAGGAPAWHIVGICGLILAGMIALLFIRDNRRFRKRELSPRKPGIRR